MNTYYIYSFSDFGGIQTIELTEDEFKEMKESRDCYIFKNKKNIERFNEGEDFDIDTMPIEEWMEL